MEPACSAVKAAEPLSRVQQQEQAMVGVGGVTPDVVSPGQAAYFSNVLDGRKRAPDDFLSCPHHSLQGLAVRGTAGSWPVRETACQYALYFVSVKGGNNWWGGSLHLTQKVHALLSSLYQNHCCVIDEESCVTGLAPPEVDTQCVYMLSLVTLQP